MTLFVSMLSNIKHCDAWLLTPTCRTDIFMPQTHADASRAEHMPAPVAASRWPLMRSS